MPTSVYVELTEGSAASAASYCGFHTNPFDWEGAYAKFNILTTPFTGEKLRDQIADMVHQLDARSVKELTALLAQVSLIRRGGAAPGA
jgi:2-methylcitrate dehydratase